MYTGMYTIVMNARTSEVLLSKRGNINPVRHEEARALLTTLFPNATIFSPLEQISSLDTGKLKIVTVYKSRNENGEGRCYGNCDIWAVFE